MAMNLAYLCLEIQSTDRDQALWAIPNISNITTQRPFVITAVLVGFVTYLIVFNLENIAGLAGRRSRALRDRLVSQMQQEGNPHWQTLSHDFERFHPNKDRKTPSEWWFVYFVIERLSIKLVTLSRVTIDKAKAAVFPERMGRNSGQQSGDVEMS